MKKLFAVLFVAAALVMGAFAEGGNFPTGSWLDENWNALWTVKADGNITLKNAKTGALIYSFKKDKVQDYAFDVSLDGATISFYVPATSRKYTFKRDLSLSADIQLIINPDWEETDYQVMLKFQDAKLF